MWSYFCDRPYKSTVASETHDWIPHWSACQTVSFFFPFRVSSFVGFFPSLPPTYRQSFCFHFPYISLLNTRFPELFTIWQQRTQRCIASRRVFPFYGGGQSHIELYPCVISYSWGYLNVILFFVKYNLIPFNLGRFQRSSLYPLFPPSSAIFGLGNDKKLQFSHLMQEHAPIAQSWSHKLMASIYIHIF